MHCLCLQGSIRKPVIPMMCLQMSRIISMTSWMPTSVQYSSSIIWTRTTILLHLQAGWVWNSYISASCQKSARTSNQEKTEQTLLPHSELRMRQSSAPGSTRWITSGISVPTMPDYRTLNLMSIPKNISTRIRIISGWAMLKCSLRKRGGYIIVCVWFFICYRVLTLIRSSENTLRNCSQIILLSNLGIWDSLKIGTSIHCGQAKKIVA